MAKRGSKDLEYIIDSLENHLSMVGSLALYSNNNAGLAVIFCEEDNFFGLLGIEDKRRETKKHFECVDFIHPEDRGLLSQPFLSQQKSEQITFNVRILKENASVVVAVAEMEKIYFSSADKTIAFKAKIYDAKSLLTQNSLEQGYNINFTSLLRNSLDFIYFKDSHHTLTASSQTMADITGFSSGDEHIGLNDYDIFPRELADVYYRLEKDILEGNKPNIEEIQPFIDENGDEGWVDTRKYPLKDENGKIVGLFGISRIVTKELLTKRRLKEAQAKSIKMVKELQRHRDHLEELVEDRTKEIQKSHLVLEKTKDNLSTLISNLNGMVYHCRNNKDWTMDFVSSGSIELTGYKPEDFTGGMITFNEIIHPEDRASAWDDVQQALKMKKPYMLSFKIVTSDGKLKHVRAKGRGIWFENGELEGLQGFVIDITDEVMTQEALIKTKEQVAHADKLSTLGKLVGSVAHEFNNPLYGVIGLIDNLGEGSTPEEREKFTTLAKKECWRMADMVKNLQNFYKPSEGIPSSVSMNKLVKDVLLIIGKEIKQKGINITKNFYDDLGSFEGVEDQIKQVVINLLQNASDAVSETEKEIVLTTDQNESHVILKVQDTGSGIPEENMKNLFDPFFTTKGVKGTGLGLSVSYGIVKKHGGEITVESKIGEGSTFTVSLPNKGCRI